MGSEREYPAEAPWRAAVLRAGQDLALGQADRARERLQPWVARTYHPELYRAYGEVLWALGDRYNAGRYLFLAGMPADDPGLGEGVRLFLERHRRTSARTLLGQMPAAFRRTPPDAWPPVVRQALGVRLRRGETLEQAWEATRPVPKARRRASSWAERLLALGCLYLLLSALIGTVVLLYFLAQWLAR